MKKIYILLMHTNTMPAKIIKLFTRYNYSHVGIALDKSCDVIYSFGRRRVESILDGGFTIEHKHGEFFSKFDKTICKIFELEISNEQYEKILDILDDMKLRKDELKYDFIGILPRYLGIPVKIPNRYVCSYFVASLLEQAQVHKFNKDISLITPKDFEQVKQSKNVYIGMYNQYAIEQK